MFIEGIGGVKVFSTEIYKEDMKIEIVYQYLNELGVETNREKMEVFFNNELKIISIESYKIDKLLKKQFLNILKNTNINAELNNPIVSKIKTKKDTTDIEFALNKNSHKISINWGNTFDFMETPAPNIVGGDYVLGTVFDEFILKSYLSYGVEAKEEIAKVVSKMNLLLFFENIDQQRSVQIIQILSGLTAMLTMIGDLLFEEVVISKEFLLSNETKLFVDLNGKINKYDFTFKYNLILEFDNNIYNVVEFGNIKKEVISSFFIDLNEKYFNDFYDIFEFDAKDTNHKNMKNLIVIEKEEENFLYSMPIFGNYISDGMNLEIDLENLEFKEILTPEEISLKIIDNLINSIEFMQKKYIK